MGFREIEDELEALRAEAASLDERNRILGERPTIEGPAAEVRADDLEEFLRDRRAFDARLAALTTTTDRWRIEEEPGLLGRFARMHPLAAVAFASLGPAMWIMLHLLMDLGSPRSSFFNAEVQVLPVLVIALTLQGPSSLLTGKSRVARAIWATTCIWMAAGEAAAMWSLATGRVTAVVTALAVSALISAGSLFLTHILLPE
jgi:hypothetical protein